MVDLFKVYTPKCLDINVIETIIRSGKLTSGEYLRAFEKSIGDYIGNPYVVVTSNNNYASLIALILCDLTSSDNVIASPMACLASNQPIINYGAKVKWADIDPNTGTLEPSSVANKIDSNTKAIIHYHWCGYPGYIDEINAIGKEHGIPVIDDGIESFGSKYKNNFIGNVGTDITTFSFQTVRLPNSIDGGAIVLNSKDLYEKALSARDFGINRNTFRDSIGEISQYSDIKSKGYNAIMNELNSYIGLCGMSEVKELFEVQNDNAKKWDEELLVTEMYKTLNRDDISPNYWVYSILTKDKQKDLARFRKKEFYASSVHLRNDYYSCFGEFDSSLNGVAEFSKSQLSIPSGWWVDVKNFTK